MDTRNLLPKEGKRGHANQPDSPGFAENESRTLQRCAKDFSTGDSFVASISIANAQLCWQPERLPYVFV